MKNSIKLILLLAALLAAFAITKPDEESFEHYLEKKYTVKNNDNSNDIENLLNKALKSGVNIQAAATMTYTDHTLYAKVSTKEMLEEEHYIGILGFWVPINN